MVYSQSQQLRQLGKKALPAGLITVQDVQGDHDGRGAPDDSIAGHETEIPRVAALVAVVAQHEIVALGNGHRAESPQRRLPGGDQDRMFSAGLIK